MAKRRKQWRGGYLGRGGKHSYYHSEKRGGAEGLHRYRHEINLKEGSVMAYADYRYYITTYLGTAIQEADFPRLSLRASSFLDYYTQGRAAVMLALMR